MIAYQIVRSTRKTADIIVERDGSIVVRAPHALTETRIQEFVQARQFWIYKTLAEWKDLNATRVLREFKNGESFQYLGRSYKLQLTDSQEQTLMLKDGRFSLRRDLLDRGTIQDVHTAFQTFFTSKGLQRIYERVHYYAPKVGVPVNSVDVRDMGHRWASCNSKGDLAFHWKCMMAPQSVVDYLVVHELCHRHHRDHNDAFWNEVDKIIPDYRERKEWLRVNGAGLDL